MADLREVFPVLVDETTDEGKALTAAVAGQAAAAKVGLVGFAFKDSSGNVVLPQLNTEGAIHVTSEGAGVPKDGSSEGAIAGSLTPVTVAEALLNTSKTHGKIKATGSCFREAIFDVVHQDDATETIIGSFLIGPGQFSFTWKGGTKEVVSGASGTQKLILKAKNLVKESDFRGDISCLEYAAG